MATALDFFDLIVLEFCDHGRLEDNGIVFTGALSDTSLTEVVETPCKDLTIFGHCKAVICTTRNVTDLLLGKTKLTRYETGEASTFNNTTTELILLATAPSKDVALMVKSENMIASRRNVCDFLQLRKLYGSELGWYFLGEAKNSIVALMLG
jgi:hypothetical protein